MNIMPHTDTKIKTIKQGDPDFSFQADKFTMYPRATIEISKNCPKEYKEIIQQCVFYGYIKSVAHMKESEYMWEKLKE